MSTKIPSSGILLSCFAEGDALFSGLETYRGEQKIPVSVWCPFSAQTVWTPRRGPLLGQPLNHSQCPTFVP